MCASVYVSYKSSDVFSLRVSGCQWVRVQTRWHVSVIRCSVVIVYALRMVVSLVLYVCIGRQCGFSNTLYVVVFPLVF